MSSLLPSGSNNEPLKVPGQQNVIVTMDARSYIPTIIDLQGNVTHLASPTANYIMTGNENTLIPVG